MRKPVVSFSGGTLKMLAIITMLIDHCGASIVGPLRHKLLTGASLVIFVR